MLDKVKAWWLHPFDSSMDATGWFAFIGLLIIVSLGWRLILAHILEGIGE